MNVSEMVRSVNLRTDEDFPVEQVVSFLNDGIAQINMECRADFPYVKVEQDEEYVIPEKYQRSLLVTFAAARIKQNDSSQFEYRDLYGEFQGNLTSFQSSYEIPEEYKDSSAENGKQSDFSESPWTWDGGW